MKFLIDMNLSPRWCEFLASEGWDAIHWSEIGAPNAPDFEILQKASDDDRIVFTNDLDFGAILALTRASAPSVLQVRTQNVRPEHLSPIRVPMLRQYETTLQAGALIVIDEGRSRVRVLPLRN